MKPEVKETCTDAESPTLPRGELPLLPQSSLRAAKL